MLNPAILRAPIAPTEPSDELCHFPVNPTNSLITNQIFRSMDELENPLPSKRSGIHLRHPPGSARLFEVMQTDQSGKPLGCLLESSQRWLCFKQSLGFISIVYSTCKINLKLTTRGKNVIFENECSCFLQYYNKIRWRQQTVHLKGELCTFLIKVQIRHVAWIQTKTQHEAGEQHNMTK